MTSSYASLKNTYTFTMDPDSQLSFTPMYPSANTLNNYTTDIFTKSTRADIITDSVLTVQDNTISGVIDPSMPGIPGSNNRAVTKSYVDSSVNNISVPLNSVQRSSGTIFLGSNGLLYNTGQLGLKIKDKMTYNNGSGTIFSNSILNTSAVVIDQQSGSTRDYLFSSNLRSITLSTTEISNSISASNVINTSFTRISTAAGIIQDILPVAQDVIALISGPQIGSSFNFYYTYTGTEESILLYGRIIMQGNFLVYNTPLNVCTVPNNYIYRFRGIVTSLEPPIIDYYVLGLQSVNSNNQQITPLGLKTEIFKSYLNVLNDTYIIYPMAQAVISSTGPTTYTVNNIKNMLITRSGLTINSTDSMPLSINSSFPIGSGLISFSVQNVSNYSLVVGSGAESGYTYGPGSRMIPSSSVGNFELYINKDTDAYTLYSTGIVPMSGS